MTEVLRRVYRIGIQSLHRAGDNYFVRCRNRTYDSGYVPIQREKLWLWIYLLTESYGSAKDENRVIRRFNGG